MPPASVTLLFITLSSFFSVGSTFIPLYSTIPRPFKHRAELSSAVQFTTETIKNEVDTGRARSRRRKVILSADDELQAAIRSQQDEIERLYTFSTEGDDYDELAAIRTLEHNVSTSKFNKMAGIWRNNETESESLMRKRVRVSMKIAPRVTAIKTEAVIPHRSRSSTMPGLSNRNYNQSAFRAGIRIVEERTGRRYIDTPEKRNNRRKANGEALYKNNPSVPDSMMQFADEIHQEERISRLQEIELGEKTQEAIRLQNLYDCLTVKLEREPTNEEWCAASGKINMEAIRQAIEEGLEGAFEFRINPTRRNWPHRLIGIALPHLSLAFPRCSQKQTSRSQP
jgi:hypothetical protein